MNGRVSKQGAGCGPPLFYPLSLGRYYSCFNGKRSRVFLVRLNTMVVQQYHIAKLTPNGIVAELLCACGGVCTLFRCRGISPVPGDHFLNSPKLSAPIMAPYKVLLSGRDVIIQVPELQPICCQYT